MGTIIIPRECRNKDKTEHCVGPDDRPFRIRCYHCGRYMGLSEALTLDGIEER